MSKRDFDQHLDPGLGPKRILSLDGGGLRGVLSLAFLQRIEDILRGEAGPGFRLSDYYDLIGGTSTGAIIAAGLALGMRVQEVRDHYFRLGKEVFQKSVSRSGIFGGGRLSQRYDANDLAAALRQVFGARTLGSPDFRTGLIVMCKRLDTGSVWTLSNHPRAPYFDGEAGRHTVPNKDFTLWSVIRASTAAPTYFAPEHIVVTAANPAAGLKQVAGEFVDGGVSPANNPTLQMVLAATAGGYGFDWQMGAEQLHVTSIGTGRAGAVPAPSGMVNKSVAGLQAIRALESVLDDCQDMVELVMQWLSDSPTARPIDRAIGTLAGCYAGGGPSLRYHRYDVQFDVRWLMDNLGYDAGADTLHDYLLLDNVKRMAGLEKIGTHAAARLVHPEHFGAP